MTRTSKFEAAAVGVGFNVPKHSPPCSSSLPSTVGLRVGLLHTLMQLPFGVELPRFASALDEIFDVEWRVPCLSALSAEQALTADQSVPPAEEVVSADQSGPLAEQAMPPDHPVLSAEEATTTEEPGYTKVEMDSPALSWMSEIEFLASTVEPMLTAGECVDPDVVGTPSRVDDAQSSLLVASASSLISRITLPNEAIVASRDITPPSSTCADSIEVVNQYDFNDTAKPGGRTLAWSDLIDDYDDPYGPIPTEWLQPSEPAERQPPKVFAIGLMATCIEVEDSDSDAQVKPRSRTSQQRAHQRSESPREWLRRTVSCEPEEITANRRRLTVDSPHANRSGSSSQKSSHRHSGGSRSTPRDFGRERSLIPEGGWFRASIEPELRKTRGRLSSRKSVPPESDTSSSTTTSSDDESSEEISSTEERRTERRSSQGASIERDKLDRTDHNTQSESNLEGERVNIVIALGEITTKILPVRIAKGAQILTSINEARTTMVRMSTQTMIILRNMNRKLTVLMETRRQSPAPSIEDLYTSPGGRM
ncbi:hypothetical protein BC629DRAFT_1724000 [Irpex lacteus]|nr:hypothetical protein BC629DRAFT_1724000 [Irpex lacteus]